MKTKLLPYVLILGLISSACTSELLTNETNKTDITALNVPNGFDWKTTRDVTLNIKVSDIRFKSSTHVVSVYTSDPITGAVPLSKGAASTSNPFVTKISIATKVKTLFIVKTAPDGTKITQKVALDNNSSVNLSLGTVSSGRVSAFENVSEKNLVTESSPNCSAGCDISIDENTANKNLTLDSKTVCLTGSNYTVNVSSISSGGTLRICGTNITVNNLKLDGSLYYTVIVTNTGSATLNSFSWNSSNANVKNFGTLKTSNTSNLVLSGALYNDGTISFDNAVSIGSRATFVNNQKITVKGDFTPFSNVTNNGTVEADGGTSLNTKGINFVNNGTFKIKGALIATSTSTLTNNGFLSANSMQILNSCIVYNKCQLLITTDFIIENMLNLDSYIYVGGNTEIRGRAVVFFFNGSLFVTNGLKTFDGHIDGQGTTYSLFKVINSSPNLDAGKAPKITGTIQYSEPSGTMLAKHFDATAKSTTDGGIYIPKTECNAGNGEEPVVAKDSDKDGIIDSEDNYPNDADKAFDSYSTPSTVAFEDQWPNLGDYDMNDVVLAYKYQIVTNAKNKVAKVIANYTLQASGGSYDNGAGVQFELPSASIKNFSSSTGAEVEAGQTNAVVLLFKNSSKELAAWNTIPTQGAVGSKNYSFSFDVVDGPSIETFGIGSYNPFIWNNTANFGRGYETHLVGKKPTDLMNTKLFGTASDNSTGTNYYRTSNNLPWGIEIATDNFKYPSENKMITATYWYFATWATSGGVYRTDWYSNTEAGYRYTPYIFNP